MAAAPLAGDFGFDKTAEVIADYGNYASPWLGLAEKAINGDEITSDDYVMAIGNTLSAAAGRIGGEGEAKFSLQNITARLGAQLAISGAMYDRLDNKELAIDYFANAVGQEVGGLTTQALKESRLGQAAESFKAQHIADRQKAQQARNFEMAIRDMAVDELARQNPGMTETELKQLKQDMADGTVPTPAIKFMEGQKDADGNKVYGAFDSENKEIRLDKDLYDQAASGDMDATAKLLGVYLEEQGHAVASVMEQRMGVQDFRFDEGGMVARELLKDFSVSGENFGFSLNIAGNTTDFVTSADAINNVISTQFTSARLLSDRQMGSLEFSSSNNSNMYKVQSGDTFWDLAKADLGTNASEQEILARTQQYLAANEGVDPNALQVGQEVVIPGMGFSDAMTLDEIVAAGGVDLRNPEIVEHEKIAREQRVHSEAMAYMANESGGLVTLEGGVQAIAEEATKFAAKAGAIAPMNSNPGLAKIHLDRMTSIAKASSLEAARDIISSPTAQSAKALDAAMNSNVVKGLGAAGIPLAVAGVGFDTVGGYYSQDLPADADQYDRFQEASIQMTGAAMETGGAFGAAHLGGLTGAALFSPSGLGALLGYGGGAIIGTGIYYFSGLGDMVEHGWEDITRGLSDWVSNDN